VPAAHALHTAMPVSPWYRPTGHSAQLVLALASWYVPIAHGEYVTDPLESHDEPGGQSSHNVWPANGWYVPGAHASHLLTTCGLCIECAPLTHWLHVK
jgi:hypothetical protein